MAESVRFRFQCGDLPADTFQVAAFTGEEGISRLYRFDIDLVATEGPGDDGIDIDDLQDQPCRLEIATGEHQRVIHGVISRVDVLQQVEGHAVYRVALVPRVWALTLSAINAVYLRRSTPEVINGVLEERLGLTGIDREQNLVADYRAWPFRLQYGESDWTFLSALMERDGIYYYFVPGEDGERIVFCDHADGQPSLNRATIEYTTALGLEPNEIDDAIHSLILRRERLPQTVELANYNDEIPSTPIEARAEVDPRGSGVVHLYGDSLRDPDEARDLAAIRAEEIHCTKEVYHGESTSFRLAAGHRFELTGHPRPRYNGAYQILSIEHGGHDPEVCGRIGRAAEGSTPVYDNRFTALPAEVQYRPPRTTERPRIQGTVNAHIDAEGDGTYAEVDPEGRYHVVFPFHRGFHEAERTDAGKASHWLRLMQPYGGEREGMHFPLRKGTRVLVGFVGGNPDLPVINGVLPNAEQPSVLQDSNLAKGTIRSPAGNLIELDDENARIKFYSPTASTYMHLGAPNHDGEGVVMITTGLSHWDAFGGYSFTFTTRDWIVESSIWPDDTADARNRPLGNKDKDQDPDNDSTVTLKNLIDENAVAANEADLEEKNEEIEEAKAALKESKRALAAIEEEIKWVKSDIAAIQEAIDLTQSQLDNADNPLERIVLMERLDDQQKKKTFWENKKNELENQKSVLLQDIASVRNTLDQKQAAADTITQKLTWDMKDTINKIYQFRCKHEIAPIGLNEGITEEMELANQFHATRVLGGIYSYRSGTDFTFLGPQREAFSFGPQASMDTHDPDADPEHLRGALNTVLEKSSSKTQARVLKGRLSVSDLSTVSVSNGESISFTRGASYGETHIGDSVENPGDIVEFADASGLDLADKPGPGWSSIDAGVGSEWNAGKVNVSKTIGKTYSYQKGDSVSVQVGDSQSITKTGQIRAKTINEDNEVAVVERNWTPGTLEEWHRHPDSGAVMQYENGSYGVEGHGAGWNYFKSNFCPHMSLEVDAAFRMGTTIHLGVTADLDITIASNNAINLVLAAQMQLTLAATPMVDAKYHIGDVAIDNTTVTSNFPGIDSKNAITELQKATLSMASSIGLLSRNQLNLSNNALDVRQARAHLSMASLHLVG